MDLSAIGIVGLAVGLLYGLFGVGSAFATPALAVLGIPGMAAVVGPLPALVPGAAAGAWTYSRSGSVHWQIARRTIAAAAPAAVLGAFVSGYIGGPALLVLSGLMLLAIGLRVLRTRGATAATDVQDRRRESFAFVVVAAFAIGFVSGLLSNGGGFLLVPLFLLALGLDMRVATGTSLVVAAALAIPTLTTHALLGDVDWAVSGFFALGLVPGALVGARLAHALPTARLRTWFGLLLTGFAAWFLMRQLGVLG